MMAELGKINLFVLFCHKLRMMKFQNRWVVPFGFRKEKTGNFVVLSSELYLVFDQSTECLVQETPYILVLWTLDTGRLGYQSRQELCSVWFELV